MISAHWPAPHGSLYLINFIHFRTTCPRIAPFTMGQLLPQQSLMEKIHPPTCLTGQLTENILSSKMTTACVKLTKTNQHLEHGQRKQRHPAALQSVSHLLEQPDLSSDLECHWVLQLVDSFQPSLVNSAPSDRETFMTTVSFYYSVPAFPLDL